MSDTMTPPAQPLDSEDSAITHEAAEEQEGEWSADLVDDATAYTDEDAEESAAGRSIVNESREINSDVVTLLRTSESGMNQFFEQSYQTPEKARAASKSLIDAFDDKGLWLASLIQPAHLVTELRQKCSTLTSLVVTQWVRQGETHKLKMLGESLLNEESYKITHAGGQIMALLAGLLGILRPQTAQRLLDASQPVLRDATDLSLVQEARDWVQAGQLLESCTVDERIFWNRRLREPQGDWDWEAAEARLALMRLGKIMPRENTDLQLFQNAVPGCWWDMWREMAAPMALTQTFTQGPSPATLPAPSPLPANTSAKTGRGSFTLGLLLGIATMFGLAYLGANLMEAETSASAADAAQEMSPETVDGNQPPAPPIRESLDLLKKALGKTPTSEAAVAQSTTKPEMKEPDVADSVKAAGQAHPKEVAREKQRLMFLQFHPDLARLCSLVKDGTMRESQGLIQGQTSMAPGGGQIHQDLIRLLILDAPKLPEVRMAVVKQALRSIPTPDLIALFDVCIYPDSPNLNEVQQCISLLLDLPGDSMTAKERTQLQAMLQKP